MSGILMSSLATGSICYSLIQTLYINPTNLTNDNNCGYSLYPTIVSRVPNAFLLLAMFAAVCTIIGSAFLFDKERKAHSDESNIDETENDKDKSLSHDIDSIIDYGTYQSYDSHNSRDYTIKEAVTSIQFWIIFCNVLCSVYVLSFVYSDWKLFAEEYLLIEDDSFLLTLNIMAAICNLCGRMLWGAYYDWIGSYKSVMLTIATSTFFFICTLPLCINKVMTFIWISGLWFCNAATYTIMAPAVSDVFGDKYCAILTGVMMLSEIVSTGLQSGFFTIIQNLHVDQSSRWIIVCFLNSAFMLISFIIASRFKNLKDRECSKLTMKKRSSIEYSLIFTQVDL